MRAYNERTGFNPALQKDMFESDEAKTPPNWKSARLRELVAWLPKLSLKCTRLGKADEANRGMSGTYGESIGFRLVANLSPS
jgi:hypothetical protein